MAVTGFQQPSVRAIRAALEEVPGAIRDEPLPADASDGRSPASEVLIWDPDNASPSIDASVLAAEDEINASTADEPAVIFEIQPTVTDPDIRRIHGEERFGALDALQKIRGIDALGWYATFHQRSSQHGVHIPVEGVLCLVFNVFDKVRLPLARRIEISFHAILRHEIFHFAADCMAANWELATGVEVYWSARGHRNALGHIELEEGLANAYMLRGFKHPSRLLVMSRVIGYR